MQPVAVKESEHGKFYSGDAYIVLKTTQRPSSSALNWDIFFWLGEECSADEQGVAAYKTVELDDALGGAPVQHREVQGHESERFLQLFKLVQYMEGGIDSGFRKVAASAAAQYPSLRAASAPYRDTHAAWATESLPLLLAATADHRVHSRARWTCVPGRSI